MTNSPIINKKIVKKTIKKVVKKPKYRYYVIGVHGSKATGTSQGMVIHDTDEDLYYVFKYNRIKQVSMEEIIKYSFSDGYTQSYKLFDKKDHRPVQLVDGKFVEVIEKKVNLQK